MRVENHIHIRHIKLYHYEKGWNAAQSFCDLNKLFGDHNTLPSYSGRLSVILWVKHLSKLKSSFFWRSWREVAIHRQWRDSSETEFARFSAANRCKFRRVRFCSWGTQLIQPISIFFWAFCHDKRWSNCSHWSLPLTYWLPLHATRMPKVWSLKFDGRPLPSSSSRFLSLDLNFLNHFSTWLLLIVHSTKSSLRSRNGCAAFHPFSQWWYSIIWRILIWFSTRIFLKK